VVDVALTFPELTGPTIAADPAQVRYDLGNQIHWYMTGRRLDIDADVDSEGFQNLMFVLQRKVRVDSKPVYFVIDGLDGLAAISPGKRSREGERLSYLTAIAMSEER
jgi:hypothetical protein